MLFRLIDMLVAFDFVAFDQYFKLRPSRKSWAFTKPIWWTFARGGKSDIVQIKRRCLLFMTAMHRPNILPNDRRIGRVYV